jgi:hypothetical protein
MTLGMGAYGDERVGGQRPQLVPIHHEPRAVRRHVDLVTVGKHAHHPALACFVDQPYPPIDLLEGAGLLRVGRCRELP